MSNIIQPGAGILYMKIGTHANEDLGSIIKRKTQEIEDEGMAMWGYGGSTCHPTSMVQPFATQFAAQGKPIRLVMEAMESHHYAATAAAREFSVDGLNWSDIPAGINVIGSRYALVIKNLHQDQFQLPLAQTQIPLGRSQGKVGANYIQGRVDKACLEVTDKAALLNKEVRDREISLVADLHEPYAVFLRGYRE